MMPQIFRWIVASIALALFAIQTLPANSRGWGNGGKGDHFRSGQGCKSPGNATLGSERDVHWTVDQTGCSADAKPVNIAIYGIAIASRPKHGTAGVFSRYSIAYKPATGFTGEDEFSYALIGRQGNDPDKMVIHVHVTVQ